ncbi:PHD and RING finger domain-containing protein 1 isoform X2 [Protopterus annectens]|uniref:PHD and RING finger domain-containing protein 1 isoform X2 n=1 Tax=Protopterus annectens TaxID=7888 RepID=UPI001CF9A1F7|nr:PHD and RING finger domain-containing protein 1 isoform X2 [Protopterus annectens]
MECLNPPLNSVPVEEWFCPECAANSTESDSGNVTEDEVTAILAEEFPSTSRHLRSIRTRAIARTRQSERVRATVNRNRIIHARRSRNGPIRLMESSLLDETIEAVVAGLNTVVYERPLHPRARTQRKRRKTKTGRRKKKGRKKTATGVKTKGWRTTKRRRRFKRKKRTLVKTSVTPRTRIARTLGISKPLHGVSVPSVYRSAESSLGSQRADIAAPSLSVFGDPFALESSESEEEQPQPMRALSPLSMKRRLLSQSALRSHQPVARPVSVGVSGSRSPVAAESVQEDQAAAVPDLLGSILSGQNFLMMNSKDIVITRDGSLKPKLPVTSLLHQSTSSDAKEGEAIKETLQPGSTCSGGTTSIFNTEHSRPVCLNGHAESIQSNTSCSSGLLSLPSASRTSLHSSCSSNPSTLSGKFCFKPQSSNIPRPSLSRSLVGVHSHCPDLADRSKRTNCFHPSEHKSKHSALSSKDGGTLSSSVLLKTPPKRLDISDLPRIPKLKNRGNGTDSGPGNTRNSDIPDSCISKLTGNRDGTPAGSVGNSKSNDQQRGANSSGNSDSTDTSTYTSSVPGSSQGGRGGSFSFQGFKIKRPGILEQLGRPYYLPVYDPFKNKDKVQQKAKPRQSSLSNKKASTSGEIYDPFNPTGSDSSSPSNSPQRVEPSSTVAATSKLTSSETKKTDSTVKDKIFAPKHTKSSSTSASYGVSVKMRSIVSELYDNMGDDDVDGSDAEQEKLQQQDSRASSSANVRIKPFEESFSAVDVHGMSFDSRPVVEEGINSRNETGPSFQLDEDFIRKVKNKISQKAFRSRSRSGSVSSSGKKHKKQKKSVLKDSKMPRSKSKSPPPVYGEKGKIKRDRSCSSGRSRCSSNEKHKKKKTKAKSKHKEKRSKRSRSKERRRSRSRSVSVSGFTSENSEGKKKKKRRSRSREQSPSSSTERKKKKSKRDRSHDRYNKFQVKSKERKRSRSRTRSRERKKRQSRSRSTSRPRGRRSRSRERKLKSRSRSRDRKGAKFQDKSHYYEKKREVSYRSRSRSRDRKAFVTREKSLSPERKRKENYSVDQSWSKEKITSVKEKSLSPERRESTSRNRSKSKDRKGLSMWEKSPSPEAKQIEYSFKIRSRSKERKEIAKEKSQSPEKKAREVLLRSRAPRERRELGSRERSVSPEIKREDTYFKKLSDSRESDLASKERSQSPDLKNEGSPLRSKSWYRDIKVTVTREQSKSPESKDGELPVRNVSWSIERKESRAKDNLQSTETENEDTSVRRISLFRVGRESGTRARSQSPEEGLKSGSKSTEEMDYRAIEKSHFDECEIQETSHSLEVKSEDIPVRSVMWYRDRKDYVTREGMQSPEVKSEETGLRNLSGSTEDKTKIRESSPSPEVKREEPQSRKSKSKKKSKNREKSRTPEVETSFSTVTGITEGNEALTVESFKSLEVKHEEIPLIGESDSKDETEHGTTEDKQVGEETDLKSKLGFDDYLESETLESTHSSEVKSQDLSRSTLWRGEGEPGTTEHLQPAEIKREEISLGVALEIGEGEKSEMADEISQSPVMKDEQNKSEGGSALVDENKSQIREELESSELKNEEESIADDFEWLELDVIEPVPSPEKSKSVSLQKDAVVVNEDGKNVLAEVSHLDALSETTANDSVSTEEMYSMEYVHTDMHISPEHANEASLIMPENTESNSVHENVDFISSDVPDDEITFCNSSSIEVDTAEVSQERLSSYTSSHEFPQDSIVPQILSLPETVYSTEGIAPDGSHIVNIWHSEERATEEHAEEQSIMEEIEGDYGDYGDEDAAKTDPDYSTQIPGIKSKTLVKRVTWNLQDEDKDEEDSEKTTRLSFHKSQRTKEGAWKNMEPSQILNQVYSQNVPLAPLLSASLPSCVPVSQPTAEYIMQGSHPLVGTVAGQVFTSEPAFQAVPSEPAAQSITTGDFEAKVTEVHLEEKSKNAEYMKKLQIQERAVEEVKLAIKPFYQNREITKDEYKDILRKAVQKICRSRSGEINPVKVANLVKAYVEKYKHMRKYKKTETSEESHEWRMYSENPEYSQTA